MRGWVQRLLVAGLAVGAAGLTGSSATAFGEGSPSGEGTGASSSLGGSLVTPGSPVQGEEAKAAEEAKLANPNVVAEREASRTKFEGLNTEQAGRADGEAFPGVVDDPANAPPKLSAGESITSYPSDNAAQIELPEGKHGIIESLKPLAVETSPGQRVPVNLALHDAGSVFEPTTPVVGVSIPKQMGGGVSLSSVGVSLTPVDGSGAALGGSEGTIDGASVLYANTQTDTDTLVKPTTDGFELDTLLRSVDSPQQLSFKVGLPEGASLVQAKDGSGNVEVVDEGATLATVIAPSARDAVGTAVPVTMTASGNTLVLSVADHVGEYQYPIAVDPIVEDKLGPAGHEKETNWVFNPQPGTSYFYNGSEEEDSLAEAGQHMEMLYQTQGESRIYKLEMESTSEIEHAHSTLELVDGSTEENGETLGNNTNYVTNKSVLCGKRGETECATSRPYTNFVRFQQTANQPTRPWSTITSADVHIFQEKYPEPAFNTTSPTIEYKGPKGEIIKRENVLYPGSKAWLGPHTNTAFEVVAKDPGIGVSLVSLGDLKIGATWIRPYEEGKCKGVQCPETVREPYTYNSEMAEGKFGALLSVKNETGAVESESATLRVDAVPPHNLSLAGLPSTGVIDEGQLHLKAQATDGSGTTPSSGIKVLRLGLDGYTILGGKAGTCTPGPCTASGEWTLNGESIGAGKHTLELVAEDNAENIETKKYTITVRHASPLSVAPGSVNPLTGALHLSANDVSLSGGTGTLGVSRSYNSRELTGGEQGPLGPQWKLSVSGYQEVEQEPTGSVVLIGSDDARTTFEGNGKGGYISPKGDENLVLEAEKEGETIKAYLLKDPTAGTTVKYTQPGGVGPWVIASSEGALSKTGGGKETVQWERVENVTRPKLAIAPAPAGVSCSSGLAKGCRALKFVYGEKTKENIGEAPSGWGEFKGRLKQVALTAYSPSTKAMEEKPVTEYAYDSKGRLRAEWDPRIEASTGCGGSCSALRTTYGYDAEGHVTSVNPPGQEPWLLHYGTMASDVSAGRLLSVTRPPAGTSTQVKEQDEKSAPTNTAVPTLSSTSPVIGTTLSIASNGTWSNSPLAYSDAWEDCYTYESKETCTPIPGAVNNSYSPQPRDAGYTLRAQVTAVNADGASVATTTASKALAGVAPAYLGKFGEKGSGEKGQFNAPVAAAIDHEGNVWVVDHNNDRVEEWSATGTWLHTYGAKGTKELQFESPEGIAINTNTASPSYGDVYVADKGNNRIEELGSKGEYIRSFGSYGKEPGQLSAPEGIVVVPAGAATSAASGEVWVGDSGNDRVDEFSEKGEYIGSFGVEGSGEGQFKSPDGIAFSGEDAYVVDSGNDRVQEFSMSGQYVAKFGAKGSGSGQFEAPYGIATEPVAGDLYVADSGNNRIQEFSPSGAFVIAYGKKGEGSGEFSGPDGVAVNPTGDIYVADTANNRVQELEPKYSTSNPLPEPPALGTSAVSTIDYNVPVTGSGAPHEMTATELEKWGQKDDPTEAIAIFPPDEPMGWPAKDYKRASITYYDELGHTVNHASPSGGISTGEYNDDNEVVRTLSADNRAAALKETCESKEKCKSAEISERLATTSTYNAEGTELLSTLGPEHEAKPTAKGTEKKVRAYIKYYYDEGAPSEGGPYNLVTKTVAGGANFAGGSLYEFSTRTTVTSYEGQGGLGWKLRKPTSVTTDFGGLDLTTTTVYDPTTGAVIEKRSPGAAHPHSTPIYQTEFGGWESQHWQLSNPRGVAVDKEGHVWIADANTDTVEEFNAIGEYMSDFGSKGSGNGQLNKPEAIAIDSKGNFWVADTGNYRIEEFNAKGEYVRQAGTHGTGNGEFERPEGIAVNASGDAWVTDADDARVEEFNANGEYVTQFGKAGSGNGELSYPQGIAIDSSGNMWVADYNNDRIEEFNSKGEYVSKIVSNGETHKFGRPEGVAIGASGHVWITSESIAYEFEASGSEIREVKQHGRERFYEPWRIAADGSGHVWMVGETESAEGRVEEFNETGEYLVEFGMEGEYAGQLREPDGVAVDSKGNVWVADTGNYRVQEFNSEGGVVRQFGSYGSGNGQFEYISGIAVDASGNVWVADSQEKRVQEFNESGAYVTQFTVESEGEGERSSASGITIRGTTLWIVAEGGQVREYNEQGKLLSSFGGGASTIGKHGIAVDGKGHVWVVETREREIGVAEYSETGERVRKAIHQFYLPAAGAPNAVIGADSAGNVWVAGSAEGHPRVQEFNSGGEYITQIGSSAAGPEQFTNISGIAVDSGGNVWVSDRTADRVDKYKGMGEGYVRQVTTAGTTTAALKKPYGVAVDSSGDVWIADTENNCVEEFSATGVYMNRFGSEGTAFGQFKGPRGIAIDKEGHVWVTDTGNDRVEEFSSSGAFVRAIGSEGTGAGKFKKPTALTIDSSGNVWVADTENNRVQEFTSNGVYLREISEGILKIKLKTPEGVAVDSKGDVWVVSGAVIEGFSSTGEWIGEFGKEGTGNGEFKSPAGITISGETAYVVDRGNNRVEKFKQKTKSEWEYLAQFGATGTGNAEFKEPQSIALDAEGHAWVADAGNNRAQELTTAGVYTRQITTGVTTVPMQAPDGVAIDSTGHVWVADTEKSRVDELSSTGEYINRFGTEGTGNVQFKKPRGIAVDATGNIWVADTANDRVEEISSAGSFIRAFGSEGTETGKFKKPTALAIDSSGNVWVADTENNRVQEFSSTGTYLREYTEGIEKPEGIAADASGDVWVSNTGKNAVVELSSTAQKLGSFGSPLGLKESGNGEFDEPAGIAISGETAYVVDRGNSRVEEFQLRLTSGEGEYLNQFGAAGTGNGQLTLPQGVAADKEGHVWIADSGNNRVQELLPPPESPLVSRAIYYTAAENKAHPACGKHPEWAELPCQSQPAGQPGTAGLPSLPVVTDETYNIWDEPETITESFAKVGSYAATTRTKKMTYDSAGRLLTSEETSSPVTGSTLPKVMVLYSSETGAMVEQSTTAGETTKTIKSAYDTFGQLTEYTDADGNTTQYVYSGPTNDGQIEEVNYGGKKGSQIYSHNSTTKALEKLLDVGPEGGAGAGTFTASYDVEGKLTSETYPNGMTAKYTYNPASEATGIEYEKTTHCTEKCVWFSETIAPGIHGERLTRTSTLAKEEYTYDNAGRLTQVNETPTGKGCKTRIYAYDEDSDRTSETTRESETETCATSGGAEEKHAYDTADRLIDSGVEYETFGNQTKIPENDAEKHAITASFYVDNQVATQTQNGETTNYTYDPAGRTEKTVSEGTTKATVVNHYSGPGEAISWSCEEAAKECEEGKGTKWTRDIPGVDGSLGAVEKSGQAAILQLHDLEGDVVATAAVSETETKLLTTYNPTEFGVPVNGAPPTKYSWLGASGLATEQSSGAANPGGSTYDPQLGAPLQTEPITPPGAIPNGLGSGSAYVAQVTGMEITSGNEAAKKHAEEGAAEEKAAELAAEEKILQQCQEEGGCHELEDPIYHYRAWEAKQKGEEITKLAAAGNLTGALGSLFGEVADAIGDYVKGFGIVNVALEWVSRYGEFLEACASKLHESGDSHGGCRAQYNSFIWGGSGIPEFFENAAISECLNGKANASSIDGLELSNCTRLGYPSEEPKNLV
jgi:DNA-binding beta-propeller fold protein YncE